MNAVYQIRVAAAAAPVVPVNVGDDFEFNRRVSGAIAALAAGSMFDVGTIVLTALTVPSSGWLICDGSAVNRSDFPALFAAIGTSYGVGDGTLTFNIPTQAQCTPDTSASTSPQVITGGSVQPTTPPPPPPPGVPGSSGGNNVTGGRVPRLSGGSAIP